MSGAERAALDAHAAWLRKLLADGLLITAGICAATCAHSG